MIGIFTGVIVEISLTEIIASTSICRALLQIHQPISYQHCKSVIDYKRVVLICLLQRILFIIVNLSTAFSE
jgi:hypothetical protein